MYTNDKSSSPPRNFRRLRKRKITIEVDEDEIKPSTPPRTRGEKNVALARGEPALAVTRKRTSYARRSIPTEEKDSFYHAVCGKHDQLRNKIHFAEVQQIKREFFERIKNAPKLSSKCSVCRMSEKEFESERNKKKHKKNTYIFIEDEPLENSSLYYTDANGQYERVSIQDLTIFKNRLKQILGDKKDTSLNDEEVEWLITSNGGHTPSKLFRLRNEAIKNLIIDGCCTTTELSAAHANYVAAIIPDDELRRQYWCDFEKYLCQHQGIIDFITATTLLNPPDSLQDKFNDVLSRNRIALYTHIAAVPVLKQKFNEYRNKLAEGFNWSQITQSEAIIAEYLRYLESRAQGLLPQELHMFALIFDIRIALYIECYDVPFFVETFNSGVDDLKEIQLNAQNNFQRLEKAPELSFQTIIKEKPTGSSTSEIIDPIKMIEKLKAMLSILGNRPIYEQGVIDNALFVVKQRDTTSQQRLEIARLLSRMGYLLHGNLNPVGKTFKPEKIGLFNFEKPFMELKASLKNIIRNIDKDEYGAFGKRNKLIANIAFNITYLYKKEKHRIIVYLPVYIPETDVMDKAGHHSEHALYEGLVKKGVFEAILNQLAAEVARFTKHDVSSIRIYKVNAVVLQILSRFRSCDDCHNEGLSFLRGDTVLAPLKQQLAKMNIKIPSKKHKDLAVAIQFSFDISPLTDESENLYTRPLYCFEQKEERANFVGHRLFIQRQTRKLLDQVDVVRLYTLFLSKGSYNLVSRLSNRPARIQAIRDNILPWSEEQEDLYEALKEWEYTGEFTELDELGECGFCGYPEIRYEYVIANIYNGNTLTTGSVCITGFQDIRFYDEDDLPIHSEEARLTRAKTDKKFDDTKLVLTQLSDDKLDFSEIYDEKGYLTPSLAVKFINSKKENKIKKRFKLKIKEESDDTFEKLSEAELSKIYKWCNDEQREKINELKLEHDKKTKKKGAAQKITPSKFANQPFLQRPYSHSASQNTHTTSDESDSDFVTTSSPFSTSLKRKSTSTYSSGHYSSPSLARNPASSLYKPRKIKFENQKFMKLSEGIGFREQIARGIQSNDKSALIAIVKQVKTLWLTAYPNAVLSEIKAPCDEAQRAQYLKAITTQIESAKDTADNSILGETIFRIQRVLEAIPILDKFAKSALTQLSKAIRLLEDIALPEQTPTVNFSTYSLS